MKKIIVLLFSFGAILLLAACNAGASTPPTSTPRPQVSPTATRTPAPSTTPTETATSTSVPTTPIASPTSTPPPAATTSMLDAMTAQNDLSQFVTAINAFEWDSYPKIAEVLNASGTGDESYTLLAPSNEALNAMTEEQKTALVNDQDALAALLNHLIVMDVVHSSDFWKNEQKTALDGSSIEFGLMSSSEMVTDPASSTAGHLVLRDIQADNGLVQVISAVLMPAQT